MASFAKLYQEARKSDAFWAEKAMLEFTSALYQRMREQGKSNADLAQALGTSNGYITRIFNGNARLDLNTMARLARAVGCKLAFDLPSIEPEP